MKKNYCGPISINQSDAVMIVPAIAGGVGFVAGKALAAAAVAAAAATAAKGVTKAMGSDMLDSCMSNNTRIDGIERITA